MKIKPSADATKYEIVNPPKGSGFGSLVEGEPIVSPSQVKVGDLLTEYSIQFNACNLVLVTSVEVDTFHGRFVDPNDTSKPRIGSTGDICYWDWDITPEKSNTFKTILHRAVSPIVCRRFRLQASDSRLAVDAAFSADGRKMLEWFAARNGHRFMLADTNPVARIVEVDQTTPTCYPLMVEYRIK